MSTFTEIRKTNENKDYAYQYYLKKGYRPIEAAAIVGNLDIESGGFSSDVIQGRRRGDNNTAFGAAQWRHERQDKLRARYKDPNNLDNQLDFVDWELNNTHKSTLNKMRASNSVKEATSAFTWDYERPHKDYAHFNKRLASASKLLGEEYDEETQYSDKAELKQYGNPIPDFNSFIRNSQGQLESSTTKYEDYEEEEPEVQTAKNDIAEKSFMEDLQKTVQSQQEQISNLQKSMQPQEPQEESGYTFDEMPDPYNYIKVDDGLEEYEGG